MNEKTKGLLAFIETIECIADNKYVLGDLLVEIGVSGPTLEATLSSVAMAQGELGHARLLYNWTFDLKGIKKADIEKHTGKVFESVVNVKDWISLISSLYVTNVAFELVLKSMLEANRNDVVGRINKLLKEKREHIMYSRGWILQLLEDRGAVPLKTKEALQKAIPDVHAWLSKLDQSSELANEGFLMTGSNLAEQFRLVIEHQSLKVSMDVV